MPNTAPRLPLPQRPEGLTGRAFGWVMERLNHRAYLATLEALAPQPGEQVLEIGFGTGRFADMLLARCPVSFVAGVDPAQAMVETAVRRPGVRAHAGRTDLRLGDASSLPWDDAHFDAVVAIHSFQFWEDARACMSEITRVLRPSGRIVFTLRDHAKRAPPWLPNSISCSGDEIAGVLQLFSDFGLTASEHRSAGSSRVLVAQRSPRSALQSAVVAD